MAALIVASGAVTPIGLSLAETAASARARVARLRECAILDRHRQPFIVGSVVDGGLPPLAAAFAHDDLQPREARMLRLGHAALVQALASLPRPHEPVPLLLGLPEQHSGQPIEARRFLARLATQSQAPVDVAGSFAVACGRAAGVMALKQALLRLERNEVPCILVGGIDSLVDPYVLSRLDAQGRVRGDTNSDGFSPSEGAVFLLLATEALARERGLTVLARVRGAALGREAGHWYSEEPYRGDGLAQTFSQLLDAHPPASPVACIYASFNGEHYWARELGTARIRNARHFADDLQMEHPAECFGDLGAACGPALVALAAHGLAGEYRRSPCLAYASSDMGERAALLLERHGLH